MTHAAERRRRTQKIDKTGSPADSLSFDLRAGLAQTGTSIKKWSEMTNCGDDLLQIAFASENRNAVYAIDEELKSLSKKYDFDAYATGRDGIKKRFDFRTAERKGVLRIEKIRYKKQADKEEKC